VTDRRHADWEAVLRAAAELQRLVPGTTLVGGTAAAVHARHRVSDDADHVLSDLRERFDDVLEFLEGRREWVTHRVQPGVLILGSFRGVETGLRQLRRARPLEVEQVTTPGGALRVPSPRELLRIKGWLIVTRNATRDYIDFAALSSVLGEPAAREALAAFDDCYRDVYRQDAGRDVSPLLQLARQLSDPRPYDLEDLSVADYKGIVEPWDDWAAIRERCVAIAAALGELLTGREG
jgi:hypothetical protein